MRSKQVVLDTFFLQLIIGYKKLKVQLSVSIILTVKVKVAKKKPFFHQVYLTAFL